MLYFGHTASQRIVIKLTSDFSSQKIEPPLSLSEYGGVLYRYLERASVTFAAFRMFSCGVIVAFFLVGTLNSLVIALILLLLVGVASWVVLDRRIAKRVTDVDRDLPALLVFLASSVRAGLDPLVALVESQHYLQRGTILHSEVITLASRVVAGDSEETLLKNFCRTVDHADLPLLRSCLLISRRHGASIADSLHRVNKVVRQRQSFRRKIRTALVMHRMSAFGIAICAMLIACMQITANYSAVVAAFFHPVGRLILYAGISLIVVGVIWMMSMGRGQEGA